MSTIITVVSALLVMLAVAWSVDGCNNDSPSEPDSLARTVLPGVLRVDDRINEERALLTGRLDCLSGPVVVGPEVSFSTMRGGRACVRMVVDIIKVSAGRYRAHCLALPGCVAQGRTAEETRQNMEEAVRSYIASLDAAVPDRLNLLFSTAVADTVTA